MTDERNEYIAFFSKIRKLWVSKITQEQKDRFKSLEKEERFQAYKKIDNSIFDLYVRLLREERETKTKVDTDLVLDRAVSFVIEQL